MHRNSSRCTKLRALSTVKRLVLDCADLQDIRHCSTYFTASLKDSFGNVDTQNVLDFYRAACNADAV